MRGEECGASDVIFNLLKADTSIIRGWSELLRTKLVGIADVHNRHGELYLDTAGRYFWASSVDDGFCFEGATFSEAMTRLLLGRRGQPILRPGENEVIMYGEVFAVGDPRIYDYR